MSKQLGSAIKSMRKSRDWTQAKLGELLNVSDKTISSWEKGRTEPKLEEMIRIADIFNISVTSLSNLPWEHLKASSDSSQWIPVMGRVAAGIPLGMIADDILDYEEIPSSMGWCFALRIQGDSMSPDIPNGSTVIVRKQDDVESGEIAIVTINGEDATCKRVIKHELGITLASLNPSFEPMVFSNHDIEEMPIRILGRVMEVRRRF